MMGMTVVEKILARASGRERVSPGDLVFLPFDIAVLIDTNFYPTAWRDVLRIADPERVVVIFDHRVPASDQQSAAAHAIGRDFVRKFGIRRFHDVGRDLGISHVVVDEQGYALPGTVLICDDSHTCSAGAFNCAARGVGEPDMIYGITTGETWFPLGATVRYELEGRLAPWVAAKDVFLHIAGKHGEHANQNLEFGGAGVAHLGMDARRTLTTMAAELSAEFAVFEPDEIMLEHVRRRTARNFAPQYPDDDAQYRERRTIDLAALEPLVALPDAVVRNSVPVGEVAGQQIDQAFIGSCANGTLEDLEAAADVIRGRRVAAGVRFLVTPASQAIYREALRLGYVETLMEAGAVVTNATCGACSGGHMGVLGPGDNCITSSTRNFKGRMGDPSARIFMGSSATVAASAVAGRIVHPAEIARAAR
jgi:3-isopropylmalate/(R)-2-methylmalate dehydratase large subunit